jgi:hypothetical protein
VHFFKQRVWFHLRVSQLPSCLDVQYIILSVELLVSHSFGLRNILNDLFLEIKHAREIKWHMEQCLGKTNKSKSAWKNSRPAKIKYRARNIITVHVEVDNHTTSRSRQSVMRIPTFVITNKQRACRVAID